MVEGGDSRVDFATAEALAFGTLMLHHTVVGPRDAGNIPADPDEAAALGLNLGHYGEETAQMDFCRLPRTGVTARFQRCLPVHE
jgi:hypothetical protein